MNISDARFSLSSEKYLEKKYVLVYIEDAIVQLLEHKDENPKVVPSKFFTEYFTSVKEGNHTLFRDYNYIKATPHNRSSFVKTFCKCFRNIGRKGDLLSISEYHSLLCLLCSDFSFTPLKKTARIILMDDATDCLISFSDFLYAFQIQFCFEEFLQTCQGVYKELSETKPASHDPVVVPTSERTAEPREHTVDDPALKPDGVDSTAFFRALIPICENMQDLAPSLKGLKEILNSAERVTFYGFLMAMTKSQTINESIGMLPAREELLETSDQEASSDTNNTEAEMNVSGKQGSKSKKKPHRTSRPKPDSNTLANPLDSHNPLGDIDFASYTGAVQSSFLDPLLPVPPSKSDSEELASGKSEVNEPAVAKLSTFHGLLPKAPRVLSRVKRRIMDTSDESDSDDESSDSDT